MKTLHNSYPTNLTLSRFSIFSKVMFWENSTSNLILQEHQKTSADTQDNVEKHKAAV